MAELFDSHCGAFDCSDPPQHLEQLVQLLRAAYALIHLLRVVVSQNQNMVNDLSAGSVRLFSQPAPAVLTTYRKDGSAATSPVWFRYRRGNVEVVLADGDTKLGQLERDPRCSLTIFETQPPFRGVGIEGAPRLENR
jgi:Pyridoxamine 5'-phosphate oxidase